MNTFAHLLVADLLKIYRNVGIPYPFLTEASIDILQQRERQLLN